MNITKPIRVLIVDDSALIRSILKQVIGQDPDFEVAGEASNGKNGCEANLDLEPDMIIMDINMPIMDGLEATRRIMKEKPVPIIIFSSSLDAKVSFEAVSAGAVDMIPKPDIDRISSVEFLEGLKKKIRAAMETRARRGSTAPPAGQEVKKAKAPQAPDAIVLGASTGGPLAVREILSALPRNLPVGIALVQHLEESFDQGYAAWLNESSELKVHLATGNDRFNPGEVIIAPVNSHLVVRSGRLELDDGPRVQNQKPAVDVLFSTAAAYYRDRLLGVLLTGMGRDGADGCRDIVNAGGYTLVQDQATSAIFGMPRAAIEAGAASEVVGLPDMAKRIISLLEVGTPV